MKRNEHLQWCKDRANQYVNQGDLNGAFASFTSDMNKHDETSNHLGIEMGMMLLLSGNLSTPDQMRNWIDGFN
jgi:hypothetical protein